MDERIEAFLKDVLALEGEISNLLREGRRRISSATRVRHNVRHTWAALSFMRLFVSASRNCSSQITS
jgi:hypothetical protein